MTRRRQGDEIDDLALLVEYQRSLTGPGREFLEARRAPPIAIRPYRLKPFCHRVDDDLLPIRDALAEP